jgi:hypothetical protein
MRISSAYLGFEFAPTLDVHMSYIEAVMVEAAFNRLGRTNVAPDGPIYQPWREYGVSMA